VVAKLKIDIDTMREHLADSINRYEAMRTMPVQTAADRTALLGAFRVGTSVTSGFFSSRSRRLHGMNLVRKANIQRYRISSF